MAGLDATSGDHGFESLDNSLGKTESAILIDDALLDLPGSLSSIKAMEATNPTAIKEFDGNKPFEIVMDGNAEAGDHLHEQPASPKEQYLDAVRDFVNNTNAGEGLSKDFFQIADTNVLLPKVNQWVHTVDVDPASGNDGKVAGVTTPDFETLAIFRGHPDGGSVKLPVNPGQDGKTSFHEAIHAADFHAGGDGIDDSAHYATHYFDNQLPGIVKGTRNLDNSLNTIIEAVRNGDPRAAEYQQQFDKRLDLMERQVTDMSTDSGWNQAMQATGARFDFKGYRQAVNERLRQARTGQ